MSLVILLLSSFFFVNYLHKSISQATISEQELALIDSIEFYIKNEQRLSTLLETNNRGAWVHLAKIYAQSNGDVAFQLASYYFENQQKNSAVLWFKAAIRLQNKRAHITLANYYFHSQQYKKAKELLLPIISEERALILLYKLALKLGDIDFITQYESTLAAFNESAFYHELVSYSVFNWHSEKISKSCDIDVQLFATSLSTLRHAKYLIEQFQQTALSQTICLYPPKYIAAGDIECQHYADEMIKCNASVWGNRSDIISRYIGVVVEQGGANVDNGIMYLDQQDDVNVLSHELSHFLGFIDEYPLPVQHQKCQQTQESAFAHNIVTLTEYYRGARSEIRNSILSQLPWASLIKTTTPILSKVKDGWQLGTPKKYRNDIGVFPAKSCQKNSHVQAFKPYAGRTKLEYFELPFPQAYIDMLKHAPKRYLMPSYHYNVSRDLVREGKIEQARDILRSVMFD